MCNLLILPITRSHLTFSSRYWALEAANHSHAFRSWLAAAICGSLPLCSANSFSWYLSTICPFPFGQDVLPAEMGCLGSACVLGAPGLGRPLLASSQTTGWGRRNGPRSRHRTYRHNDFLQLLQKHVQGLLPIGTFIPRSWSQGMSAFISQGESTGLQHTSLCSSHRRPCVGRKQNQNPGVVLGKYVMKWDGGEDPTFYWVYRN